MDQHETLYSVCSFGKQLQTSTDCWQRILPTQMGSDIKPISDKSAMHRGCIADASPVMSVLFELAALFRRPSKLLIVARKQLRYCRPNSARQEPPVDKTACDRTSRCTNKLRALEKEWWLEQSTWQLSHAQPIEQSAERCCGINTRS